MELPRLTTALLDHFAVEFLLFRFLTYTTLFFKDIAGFNKVCHFSLNYLSLSFHRAELPRYNFLRVGDMMQQQ